MAINSKIEWTEATWNPVTGCTKISDGCANCYAEALAKRLKAMGNKRYTSGFDVVIHDDIIERPLHWKKGKMIFVNSMSDLFHDKVDDDTILRIFRVMNEANWHIFQVLTKRPKRLLDLSNRITWTKNIWMGVTVENNQNVGRAELLKKTDACVKFVSAEPLLDSLNSIDLAGIDWLIVGGESGPKSRHMEEKWVVDLEKKATETNTAFFFKQWGGVNKKKSGNRLHGRIIQNYPNVSW